MVLGIYLCGYKYVYTNTGEGPPLDRCRARVIYTFLEGKVIDTEQKSFFCSKGFSETKRFLLFLGQ